ncbi:MAG: hypothetical protein KGQ59_08495, partial [Bdellovibrionales bacterium]|nr:hypothetical protein [Bdellovibrionales bacterium]
MDIRTKLVKTTLISAMMIFVIALSGCAAIGIGKSSKAEAQNWVNLAEASLGDNDPTGALQELLKAEAIDADLPALHHVRALAYLAKSDLSLAEISARKAHELDPKNSALATTYGKILMDL